MKNNKEHCPAEQVINSNQTEDGDDTTRHGSIAYAGPDSIEALIRCFDPF